MASFTKSHDGNYTIFFTDGNVVTINGDNQDLVDAFKRYVIDEITETEFQELIDHSNKKISDYVAVNNTDKNFEYIDGFVYYKNRKIPERISHKILTFLKDDLPFKPLLNFVKRLYENPSYAATQELFDFLDHKNMPITPDGCFLAYKVVQSNFLDKYSQSIDNSVGKVVSMPRNMVDDNRREGCSDGLHVGTIEYVKDYGSRDDVILIVKVDPKNVVSVPDDHDFQKLRCCEYTVQSLFVKPLDFEFYNDNSNDEDDYEDDEDDEDDYEDHY